MGASGTGWRRSSFELDGILVLAVFAADLAGAAITAHQDPGGPQLRWWGVVELAIGAGALLFRRRSPLVVCGVVGAATAAYGIAKLPDPPIPSALLVAVYTVAALRERRVVVLAGAITVVAALVSTAVAGDSGLDDYYRGLLPCLVAVALGDRARTRTAYLREAEQRASDLERERDLAAERAAAIERTRIARELHDVVAHHVSMMVVQAEAGAARASAAAEPGHRDGQDGSGAGATFDAISATGRSAMTELRRLLGVLRADEADGGPLTAPQPGVDRLASLVKQVREAGVDVELTVEGRARPLADGVGVSAYRIVQEGLTNVIRHAGSVPARVGLRYAHDAVELVVTNGPAPTPTRDVEAGDGRGLIGIRERVQMLGGELRAGRTPDGGFELRVRLPAGTDQAARR